MSVSETVAPYKPKKKLDMFARASHGKVGMWMFLGTDALTFAGFLLGYQILRVRNPNWPNPSQYLGMGLSAFATFILICSSVSMVIAQAWGEANRPDRMLKWLLFTALGGACFLGIQAFEYHHLFHGMGMSLSDFLHGPPQFASTFFVITGFHGMHVFSGVVYLLVMALRVAQGKHNQGDVNTIEICGLFWHFVDLVWILVFTFIYLI